MAVRSQTPLDVFYEVENSQGARYRWDHNQPPACRLRNVQIASKIGEGFSTLTGTLPRRIDLDYSDLQLGNRITAVDAAGFVIFEGRLSAMPRELGQTHQISVTFAGHMAHTKDRKFSEVYVDRDLGNWQTTPPLAERVRLAAIPADFGSFSWASEEGAMVAALPANQALVSQAQTSAWYTAPNGVTVAKVGYQGVNQNLPGTWNAARIFFGQYDSETVNYESVTPTLDDTLRYATPTTERGRYTWLDMWSGGSTATPSAGANRRYSKLAVYGSHDLTLHTGETGEPDGVYASDVIRHVVGTYCPSLNVNGVEDSSYVIQHLRFDRAFPYDALLEVNKFHLWHLGVWDNRTLHFRPYDLSDYDWEIRTDDPGITFNPAGLTIDDLFNGIDVTYTDVLTGKTDTLLASDYTELQDSSPQNPWNQWSEPHYDEITLSSPTVAAQALQIGRAALAEKNRPKTAGTITAEGYIRDRAGILRPVSNVRAGDVICVTNFNEINRLIVEASYDDESKVVNLAIDFPFQTLEALFDRQASAAAARGLR